MDGDMAGTFQVLWGSEEGFKTAKTLTGTDGEPLLIPADDEEMLEKICTRPFAADIDNDGNLDLVVGNFGGTFYTFKGEGEGKFDPKPEMLNDKDGKRLKVGHHSDPFLVDWDSDGDFDIVSGDTSGGISVSFNEGNSEKHAFKPFEELVKANDFDRSDMKFGTSHITRPQSASRVWVDDVNGDGKLDLIVGDSTTIYTAAEGIEESEVQGMLDELNETSQKLSKRYFEISQKLQTLEQEESSDDEKPEDADEEETSEIEKLQEELDKLDQEMQASYEKQEEIMTSDYTGFVWVYYQK